MARAPRANNRIAVGAKPVTAGRPKRRRRFAIVALGTLVVLGGGVYLAAGSQPALRFALEQARAAGFDITARELRGNLFGGIEARDATVKSAFVNGSVRSVRARYDLWALLTRRQVKLDVALDGGKVNFDPGKLPAADPKAPPAPVSISLQSLAIKDTSLTVAGKSFASPDVKLSVLEQRSLPGRTPRGDLKLALEASGGSGTATVRYDLDENLAATLDIKADLDARIARYWYDPIRAGRVQGTVKITPKFVTAQAQVVNGVLEPLKGLFVRDVTGRANLTADTKVSALLTGKALDGAVEADIGVDIARERWSVLAKLNPSVASALSNFAPGVAGSGRLAVTVRGGGWNRVALNGTVNGSGDTSVTGFPLQDLSATWNFTDHLELQGAAVTKLGADPIRLNARVRSQGARVLVNARANGDFLRAPLRANANISTLRGNTALTVTGTALRGAVNAKGTINGDRLNASGDFRALELPVPFASSLSGTAQASGSLRDLGITGRLSEARVSVPGVRPRDLSGDYALNWNGQVLSGNARLGGGALTWRGGIVNTGGAPARGSLKLSDLALDPTGRLSADLAYTLKNDSSGDLSGTARGEALNLQGASLEALRGPIRIAWKGSSLNGEWNADRANLSFTERALRLRPRDLRLEYGGQSLALNGDATLTYAGLGLSGTITGRGALGDLRLTGEGQTLRLEGSARYAKLRLALNGTARLQPLKVQLRAEPSSPFGNIGGALQIGFDRELRLEGTILSGQRTPNEPQQRLEFSGSGAGLTARGSLDLSVLDNVLPEGSQGALRGVAAVRYSNNNGSAEVRGSAFGLPVSGRLALRGSGQGDLALSASATITGGPWRGVVVNGQVLPVVNARVQYGPATARVRGSLDDLSFTASGRLPRLEALEQSGLRLSDESLAARGRFTGGALTLSGQVGALNVRDGLYRDGRFSARLNGDLRARYNDQPLALLGLNAGVRYAADGLSLDGTARAFEGRGAGARVRLEAVRLAARQAGNRLSAQVRSDRGTATYGGERLVVSGTEASATLNGSALQGQLNSDLGGQWQGERASGRVAARLGLNLETPERDWTGTLNAEITGKDWRLRARGPWSGINLSAVLPSAALERALDLSLPENFSTTLRAEGRLALPSARYEASFSAALGQGADRLRVNGRAGGTGADWVARASLRDSSDHSGSLEYSASNIGTLRATDLNLTALTTIKSRVSGSLSLRGPRLRGALSGSVADQPFTARWLESGGFSAELSGAFPLQLRAERWDFPLAVTPIELQSRASSLPLTARATLNLTDGVRASGELNLKPYRVMLPGGGLELPAQTLGFTLQTANGLRLRVTGPEPSSPGNSATYDGERWSGGLNLGYRAWDETARLGLIVSGELADPQFVFATDGLVRLEGEANLREANARGSLQLEPLTRDLPADLRARLEPGRVQLNARFDLRNLGGTLNANLLGTSVDGEAASLTLSAALGEGFAAQGSLSLGSSQSRFRATGDGLEASQINLDLRLLRLIGVRASGRLLGALNLPQYRLDRGQGALELRDARYAEFSADGALFVNSGQVSADLRGQLPGGYKALVQGDLYPRANAALRIDELEGRFTGTNLIAANRRAALELEGRFQGKTGGLKATLEGRALRLGANWDALQVTASGTASERGVDLRGNLEARDLRGIAGVDGNLRGALRFDGNSLSLTNLKGRAAGFNLSASALYKDGALSVSALEASNADFTARGSGQVLPELAVQANLESRQRYAPGTATLSATGSLSAPKLRLNGALGTAKEGLIVPGTRFEARLEAGHWTLALNGERLSGVISGNTASADLKAIEAVNLKLDAPLQLGDTRLQLRGNPGWNGSAGFSGSTEAGGVLLGSPASARLEGTGPLEARLAWRGGNLIATLPAQIGEQLKADLRLERFDIGALWQKPEQLAISGSGSLSGAWTAPEARFNGNLESREGSLNGRLEASYSAASGAASASLRGERLSLDASLEGGAYSLAGRFDRVALAALLPLEVRALTVSGSIKASGKLGGTPSLELRGLDLNGEATSIGAFRATGEASLEANRVSTRLGIAALSGNLTASGQISAAGSNLEVLLNGVKLDSLGARGTLAGRVVLRGAPGDPSASGEVTLTDFALPGQPWGANATLKVSDKLLNPSLSGTLDLTGSAAGRLQVSAQNLLAGTPRVALRGTAKLPFVSLNGALEGTPTTLQGQLEATLPDLPAKVQRFTLEADGRGGLKVQNAAITGDLKLTAGETWTATALSGNLRANLDLVGLLPDLSGRVTGEGSLSGTLTQPALSFQGKLTQPRYSSLSLPDTTLNASYGAARLEARGAYNGGSFRWDGSRLELSNLPLEQGGFKLLVDANGGTAPLDLNYDATLSGNASGRITGRYSNETLEARIEAVLAGITASGSASGSAKNGWGGTLALSGLPKNPLLGSADPSEAAGSAALRLEGEFARPRLSGTAQVLGAGLSLSASLSPLEATITGVSAASGSLTLREGKLGGKLNYQDGPLSLSLSPGGTLEAPRAEVSTGFGRASARASLQLVNGKPEGTVTLSDGVTSGNFRLEGNRLSGSVPGFDLSSLEQPGYGGSLALNADLTQDARAVFGWRGALTAVWKEVSTPLTVPALGWQIDGTGRANLDTESGLLSLEYSGTPGTARAALRLQNGLWQGSVNLDLRGARAQGSIRAALELGANGINGSATANALPLQLLGIPVTVSGEVTLEKDSFTASGKADALGGQVTVSGSGGLSDLLPMLETYTKTAPGDLGYSLRARLDTVKLEDVAMIRQIAPNATGRAIGVVQVTDGVSSFQVTVPELSLPDLSGNASQRVRLGLRISGTSAGSSVRYSGRINGLPASGTTSLTPSFDGYGESQFSGSFDGSSASGLLEMRRVPLHSFIGAVIGPLPGSAVATGLARYNLNLGSIAKSELRLALERLEIEGGGDKLIGSGALNFKNGNLTLDQLDLRGKGRWTGRGRYTRDAVDLTLDFENTSFTPVLVLIPNLRDYNPDASGTVRLRLSGKYENPNATLEVQNLRGSISNIALTAQRLEGSLQNGDLKLSGTIASDETLGAVLQTTATAKLQSLSPLNVTGLEARATGSLNVRPVGLISNVNARVYGASGGFKLDLNGTKGGPLSITGDISPLLNLRLQGRNLIVPIPDYFVSDSLLDADISFRGDGGRAYLTTGQINIARLSAALNQGQRATATGPGATPATAPTPASSAAPSRPNPFLQQIKLGGIRINAPQGVRINESFASLEIGGNVTLNGTAANPEASGSFSALGGSSGRGTIRLGTNSYTVQSADATFSPVDGLYPIISVDSRGRVRAQLRAVGSNRTDSKEIDVNLRLNIRWVADARSGGARKLVIEPILSYTPLNGYEELSQSELYSLVTLGSTLAFDARGIGQQALDTAFSLFFLSEFSRQFKEATGVDLTVSTNLFDYIFNPADASLPESEQNRLNFTFSLGFDLSRAVRLDVQLNTQGGGAVNLNYQSEDGRFGIRFSTPFDLNANPDPDALYGGLKPEFALSYNISSLNAFTLGLQYLGSNNFSFKFGFSFRF